MANKQKYGGGQRGKQQLAKTKLQTLSAKILELKEQSSSEYKSYTQALNNKDIASQKKHLGKYITTTLKILSVRGSQAKEAVTSTISSLFRSLKIKISPKAEKGFIQQAVESAPTEKSSQSYVSQWISSVSRAISDAVLGQKQNNDGPDEELHKL